MTTGKPLGCEPTHLDGLAHEHAAALLGDDPTLGPQLLDRLPGRHARDFVVLHQRGLGRQLVAGHQVAAVDRRAELVRDLAVRRAVVRAVERPELHGSSRRLDLYD